MAITFDQYQRYKTIQIIVKMVKTHYNIKQLNILEVGSNRQFNLGSFLPDENITYSDITVPDGLESNIKFIQADATNLKNINDNEFDMVIAADVFEHIPKNKRADFLSETSRASKLLNLLCFPFNSKSIESAEKNTNEYYKTIFGIDHTWLKEHIDIGLPDIDNIKSILDNINKSYFIFEHGDILLWEEMTKALSFSEYSPAFTPLMEKIEDIYKQHIYLDDIGNNNYRKFIVISDDLDLNKYIENNINTVFNKNGSNEHKNLLHNSIENMRAIAPILIKKQLIENTETVTLYFDIGKGFNEGAKITCPYKVNKSSGYIDLLIDIPANVKNIRFDPIETKAVILSDLIIMSDNTKIQCDIVNGECIDNCIVFNNTDPQILINCSSFPIQSLKIQANIFVFDYDSYANILNEFLLLIKQKQKIILDANEKLSKTEKTIDDLNNRINVLETNYSMILNSTSWKITKPIRMSLNLLKKILKSNRVTRLFFKGLVHCKNYGLRFTYIKTKDYLKNSKKFKGCTNRTLCSADELKKQKNTVFPKKIKFSIVVPLYNTPKLFLTEMIDSVKAQTYQNWELCLADGSDNEHSYVKDIVEQYLKKDKRILYKKLEYNLGISENTNTCIEISTGDYIALFDHDDVLDPSVLFEYMNAICNQNADFIYCDEDKFENNINKRFDPYFKPDFGIDNLRANNYICHFTVFKSDLLKEVGLFRKKFDGSQDHDMILRLTEKAENIVHIPKILYHWRVSLNSVAADPYAKPYTIEAGIKAVSEHLNRCGLNAIVESSAVHPNIYRIKYAIKNNPLISILIPNKDHIIDLSRCINSILEKSTYKNIEIIIIENNSVEEKTFEYYEKLKSYNNINVVYWKGIFNYSAINNFGAKYAKGEHLLFLNNDTEIITNNWLEEMLMYSQREDVGAVGAKLYYPDNTIQHAGLGLGLLKLAGHYCRNFSRQSTGYMGNLFFARNVSAVTAACIMIKKEVFKQVNGLDETFEVAFNDVDLCMRIRKAGYLIVWTPYAELYHHESKSRGAEDTPEKQKRFQGEVLRFQKRWKKEIEAGDPYYNPNLTLDREDFSLR